jgi:acetyl esterase/lipase
VALAACGPDRIEIGTNGLWGLYYAARNASEPTPAVVLVHGGCFSGGSPAAMATWGRALSEAGISALAVSYRLSDRGGRFPAAVQDVRCAVQWLRAQAPSLRIDPQRVAVLGASAGAYLAGMSAAAPEALVPDPGCGPKGPPSAFVALYGAADWELRCREGMRGCEQAFLGVTCDPSAPDAFLTRASLVTQLPQLPPSLWIHGREDRDLPVSQAQRWQEETRSRDADATTLLLEGAGHGFDLEDSLAARLARREVIEFLVQVHSRPRVEGGP